MTAARRARVIMALVLVVSTGFLAPKPAAQSDDPGPGTARL